MTKLTTAAFVILISIMAVGCIEEDFFYTAPSTTTVNLQTYKSQAIEMTRIGLMDSDPLVKMHAIEVTASTKTLQLMPIVLKLTKDPSVPVRFAAAVAMGDAQYAASHYALKETLNDPDENVRMAAAYSLMKMGEQNLEGHILKALITSKDQTVKANASLLLGKLGDERALPPLYETLKTDKVSKVQIQAVEAIAMLGDEKIYERLWALMISKFADDRIMGIRAMGALKTTDARNAIMKMLKDDDIEVRICAADQLGKLGSRAGESEVMEYFSRNSYSLTTLTSNRANHLAIKAIGSIKSNNLNSYLPKLLGNTSKDLKLAAAQSLLLNVD